MFVDSHCHLNFPDFESDLSEVIARANRNNIKHFLTICTKLEEFEEILKIAQTYDQMFCSVGVHPHNVQSCERVTSKKLLKLAENPHVIGFGETGLDFFYENSQKSVQEDSFRKHIEASRISGLPVIVHARNADAWLVEILRDEYSRGAFSGLIHCFTSSLGFAEAVLELGFYISISGIVTFKSARDLQETVKMLPLERLLIETDAPYLAPTPNRGKRNEPSFISYTAQKVARIKGIDTLELGQITTNNFFSLFNRANRGHIL